MSIELSQIRELLLPGLFQVTERYAFQFTDWRGVFGTYETTIAAPHIWVPKLTLPQAVAAGAAAAIITNPVITRRFWAGWTERIRYEA